MMNPFECNVLHSSAEYGGENVLKYRTEDFYID